MKKNLLWILPVVLVLVGCRTRYEITLNNANTITSVGKPKFVDGSYVFKDPQGRTNWIPSSRVRLIQPQSYGSSSETAPYKPAR